MNHKLLLLLCLIASMKAHAYDAEIDGIYYNFSGNKAIVTYGNNKSGSYSGRIVIPETVTYNSKTCEVISIGGSAFYSCSGLASITIPNSLTSIRDYAFSGCSGLQKVIVSDIAAWCGIKFYNNPLYYAHHLYSDEDTEITELIIPDGVTGIGNIAFEGCSGLTSVTIPNSVTSIGGGAFRDCNSLTSVTIPDGVTSIGRSAFYGCSSLTSVTIPDGVTSIDDYTFYGCSSLTSIAIPNGVTSIGEYAFYNCI